MTFLKNAELQRYVWLEFSLPRLIAMPALQGIIYLIAYKGGDFPSVFIVSAIMFFLFVLGWGTTKAASAITDEVSDNTWDFQRLSAMTPLELLIGKLIGSASYAWYGGLIALSVFIISGLLTNTKDNIVITALLLVLVALLSHAFALLSSLLSMSANQITQSRAQARAHYLVGLIFGSYLFSLIIAISNNHDLRNIKWHGVEIDALWFFVISATVWLCWLLLAIYMNLKIQLRMRTYPFAWVGFLLFVAAYIAGFNEDLHFKKITIIALILFFFSLLSSYVITGTGGRAIVLYRKLQQRWQLRQWNWVIALCPRWIVSLLLAAIAMLMVTISEQSAAGFFALLTLFGFAVRDIMLFHYVEFSVVPRKVMVTIIFYMAILYGILPLLFKTFHVNEAVEFFLPFSRYNIAYYNDAHSGAMLAVKIWIQVVIVACLVYRRVKEKTVMMERSA